MSEQVEGPIIRWFVKNSHISEEDITDGINENYFEKNWLNSLQFINLISDLEESFSIRFSNEQFQDRAFSTIRGLSEIIARMLKEKK